MNQPLVLSTALLILLSLAMPEAHAQLPTVSAPFELTRVLDIEKRRAVDVAIAPSDVSLSCDVLVVGGGLGGVAAAEAAARRGFSVVIVEPTRMLGGQLTSQLVPVPDENSHVEKEPGPSTKTYRALRQAVRDHYGAQPGVKPGAGKNIGDCWVSRVSGLPEVWEKAIKDRLTPYEKSGAIRRVLMRHQLRSVTQYSGQQRINYADIASLETGKITRIGCRFLLDATEDGAALALAGSPFRVGQEAFSEFGESLAPETANPSWVQSFTYCFLIDWQAAPGPIPEKPAEYDYFKSLGEYTLDYIYRDKTEPYSVTYKVLEKAQANGRSYLPFWTYRRLIASSSFTGKQSPVGDLALINWRGNDFHEESYLDKPVDEQVRILDRGLNFAKGFAYWLQTECPRDDDPTKLGYPEMQVPTESGWAIHPYIRESRRLQARTMLTQNHLRSTDPAAKWGTLFPDSVGCALYAMDIHPSKGEPPLLSVALPYHLPLGAFLPASGPVNILPAAKNFGASRLALASARMHPTEFLAGEIAGSLAAFCLEKDLRDPSAVHDSPALLAEFQARLKAQGVMLRWDEILATG